MLCGRKAYLDGWRGVAIACVLIGHFELAPALKWGEFGVDIFFALSGRLMAEILFEQRFSIPLFLSRRFSRVWPGLLVLVVSMFLITRLLPSRLTVPLDLKTASALLTFSFNYARLLSPVGHHMLEHVWSLCVEEHSYLILILVAMAVGRGTRAGAPALAALGLVAVADGLFRTLVLHQSYFAVYWLTETKMANIMLAAAAYLWRDRIRDAAGTLAPWISPVAIGAAVILNYHRVPDPVTAVGGAVCLALGIAMLADAVAPMRRMLEVRPLSALGLWSYSIYLWQQPLLAVRETYAGSAGWIAIHPYLFVLGLTATAVTIGYLSFRLIENPLRQRLNAAWAPGRAGGTVPPLPGMGVPARILAGYRGLFVDRRRYTLDGPAFPPKEGVGAAAS